MGGFPQLITMLAVAFAILVGVVLLAFVLGKLFQNKKTRKHIMVGAIAIYTIGFLAYFGFIAFILSGSLN